MCSYLSVFLNDTTVLVVSTGPLMILCKLSWHRLLEVPIGRGKDMCACIWVFTCVLYLKNGLLELASLINQKPRHQFQQKKKETWHQHRLDKMLYQISKEYGKLYTMHGQFEPTILFQNCVTYVDPKKRTAGVHENTLTSSLTAVRNIFFLENVHFLTFFLKKTSTSYHLPVLEPSSV